MKLGLLTIGQPPRNDIVSTFESVLSDDIELIQKGALDSLSEEELDEVRATDEEVTYVSKLRNGQSIKISEDKLVPLLKKELKDLEKQVDMVVMLCTGDFPMLNYNKPIIYPDKVLTNMVDALNFNQKMGLLIPLEEQREKITEKWNRINTNKNVHLMMIQNNWI
ncbi:AroM family protein [Phocicoccus pinnipedialis]|uniref:AroM protein n=1 Tax=Phocicoccus pinnipedialis TaxID=110845 RepID=A0A6V7R4D2_9BACL|nr:AroM family protein [Jeotgalicoccus pinnipedialis]MBP1939655.1 protein AroM [Jeotgalicoccus pinnipedialis]CAD2072277.1 hypothetical protein JEOPIN946_00375 [Jeotgalicoccus pinnipedialis]